MAVNMTDKQQWVMALKTLRSWQKYKYNGHKDQIGLQIGLVDQYLELCILSKVLGRSIPSWVSGKL